eukprot:222693-Prymnesium_polylepis.1
MCMCVRSSPVVSPSLGAGPPPLPAATVPPAPAREVDTSAAPRAAGCATAAPSPGPESACM